MTKLVPGDKVWVSRRDDADKSGWAEWTGNCWVAPCGLKYDLSYMKYVLWLDSANASAAQYFRMAEQLIADSSWD